MKENNITAINPNFEFQLGVAMGFLLPPMIVPDVENDNQIATGLSIMFYSVAVICTVLFITIIFGEYQSIFMKLTTC